MLFYNVCKFIFEFLFPMKSFLLYRNGATWSGYFAALCNCIDKMQTEQIIDPFKVVRLLRAVRPQFIDQVCFCLHISVDFLYLLLRINMKIYFYLCANMPNNIYCQYHHNVRQKIHSM